MTSHYTDSGCLLIRNSDIKDNRFEFDEDPIYLEESFANKNKSRMHQIGDVITVHTGDVGTSAVIGEKEDKTLGFATIVTRPNQKIINPNYLSCFFNTDRHKKFAVSISTGDGRTNYNLGDFVELNIPVTILSEQTKIAKFIIQLNSLITLHQRKYEKLTQIKKSLLEKMFPADGEKTPKIRFKGYTEAWEQRKVADVFKITRGYVLAAPLTKQSIDSDYKYPVYSSQTLNDGLMGYYNKFLFDSAITWTTDGANAGTVKYRNGRFYCTNVCGVLISDTGLANKANAEALNNIAWKYVSKVGNPKLMNNVMGEIEFKLSKHIEEQKQISMLLDQLDTVITLHQRKCEKLKNIKKSLLEKMFV